MRVRGFYRLSLSTLIAVYVLILVGGIVRSTGSGMGCPDWPTCFGKWVPPTSADQLPENYKEIYSNYRHEKNIRFAKYLNVIGLSSTAEKILEDESIREEADFNALKTWIEYINRLIGVIIGLLIFAVFVSSIRFWNAQRSWTVVALFTFLMVGFQGWIGSFVVSTNLTPWTITVHMFLALVIVALLTWIIHQTSRDSFPVFKVAGLNPWVIGGLIALLFQILLGTQVRESLDQVARTIANRNDWIASLGTDFIIHRSFSWIVLIIFAGILFKLIQSEGARSFGLGVFLLLLCTVLSGVGMAYMSVPPALQPVHLGLASISFGTLFLLALKLNTGKTGVLVK
jgi:cytochrome c oxidase assembly protein subunit 15